MRKENPNALPTGAQVGAPTSARSPTIDPAPTAVARKTPALLIGGCADSCLLLTVGCPVASVAMLQPRGRRHEPIGLLLQKASELLPPLLLGELFFRELLWKSLWGLLTITSGLPREEPWMLLPQAAQENLSLQAAQARGRLPDQFRGRPGTSPVASALPEDEGRNFSGRSWPPTTFISISPAAVP